MRKTILLLTTSFLLLASVVMSQGEAISISEAIKRAKEIQQGKVSSAVLKGSVYQIKITSPEGNKTLYINELSGEAVALKIISVDEAVSIALKEAPGKVEKVEFERSIYEIKIKMDDGQKAKVYVDSSSGEVVRLKTWKQKD